MTHTQVIYTLPNTMPNTQSAEKSLRRDKRRKKRNSKRKEKMKKAIKKIENLIENGKTEQARKSLPETQKVIDKMAKVNLIHENKANRIKSRLARKVAKAEN
ncbi:MAG: 30S ribosomal protein S20 [Candidatus Magasanikbacteria bacterium]